MNFKPGIQWSAASIVDISGGIGYRFNPKWRLELYYLAEQSQAFSEEGFKVNSHIIQVSLRTYFFKDS